MGSSRWMKVTRSRTRASSGVVPRTDSVAAMEADPRFAASGVSDLWWVGVLIAVATFAAGTVVFERSKRRFAQEL